MTVKELIERLKTEDATVVVNMGLNELANGHECGCVQLVPARADIKFFNGWNIDHFPSVQYPEEKRQTVVNLSKRFVT